MESFLESEKEKVLRRNVERKWFEKEIEKWIEKEKKDREENEWKIRKWREENMRKEMGKEERVKRWKATVLIIKRGKKAGKGKDLEDKLGKREIKIVKGLENKEAAKMFSRSRGERNDV